MPASRLLNLLHCFRAATSSGAAFAASFLQAGSQGERERDTACVKWKPSLEAEQQGAI